MDSFIVVFSMNVLTVNVIEEEHARSVVAWIASCRRNLLMLIHRYLTVLRAPYVFIFPSHVLVSYFTLLCLVELELIIRRFAISDRGTCNALIDLQSILVAVSLFRKQGVLERIALNIECFQSGFAARRKRIGTGLLKSGCILKFAVMLVILFLHTIRR